jgi:HSP20 family protein
MLPGEVDADKVDASLDDGVLTLRIPKAEKARPKRIQVGSASSGNGRSEGGSQR